MLQQSQQQTRAHTEPLGDQLDNLWAGEFGSFDVLHITSQVPPPVVDHSSHIEMGKRRSVDQFAVRNDLLGRPDRKLTGRDKQSLPCLEVVRGRQVVESHQFFNSGVV